MRWRENSEIIWTWTEKHIDMLWDILKAERLVHHHPDLEKTGKCRDCFLLLQGKFCWSFSWKQVTSDKVFYPVLTNNQWPAFPSRAEYMPDLFERVFEGNRCGSVFCEAVKRWEEWVGAGEEWWFRRFRSLLKWLPPGKSLFGAAIGQDLLNANLLRQPHWIALDHSFGPSLDQEIAWQIVECFSLMKMAILLLTSMGQDKHIN